MAETWKQLRISQMFPQFYFAVICKMCFLLKNNSFAGMREGQGNIATIDVHINFKKPPDSRNCKMQGKKFLRTKDIRYII